MRKVISEQSFPGSTDIGAIKLDEGTRTELFRLLDAHVLPGRHRNTGRPGIYQLDTLDSAFRLLVACHLAIRGSAKSDRLRVRA